ncbi:tetraspanin-8-like [Oncorhynchus masou masou]|uniref:tetraspanin-8-like n=1 Tax=Oncorhynchus masou masou TaxID=90313 RepID=UPI003182DFE0
MAVNKCIKYLLFAFNLLFWISGCIILGVSIYLKVNPVFGRLLPGLNLLIAVGAIITVLGFLGCFGAIRESRVMLMLFFVGLLLIFILLVIAGILGAVGVNKIEEWLTVKLLPLRNQSSLFQMFIQKLEEQAKCCGLIHGPSDWGSTVPTSCDCRDTTQECKLADGRRKVYLRPCTKLVMSVIAKGTFISLGIAFGIAVLMIFGMAFAMTLFCQIGETYATLS